MLSNQAKGMHIICSSTDANFSVCGSPQSLHQPAWEVLLKKPDWLRRAGSSPHDVPRRCLSCFHYFPVLLQVPSLAEEGPACCYICDLADTPGRFHPEKAASLGVPKGPLFGRLKGGHAVQLPNGNTVQPEEVHSFFALQFTSCFSQYWDFPYDIVAKNRLG